jgi:tetratricopeptide (TPR) repeat protein
MQRSAAPTICLAMIVRNEARVIERCLRSVLPLIDYWVICDTGSTDGTPELITKLLAGVPGELHHRPWRDFGSNRTEVLNLGRGTADYLLLIDADMTASLNAPLGDLSADAYLTRCADECEYWAPRLIRGKRTWRYVGATHEYLDAAEPYSDERLPAITFTHFADGGSRADRLPRDKALLEAQLRGTPDDARTVFYLAQTLRDLGDHDEAISLYLRRARMGGFAEEAFYAAYQAGVLTAASDPIAAMPLLFDAWQLRPGRAEPLVEIARIARDHGWFHLAHAVTTVGLRTPPCEDRLFVHRRVYDWELRFEHAIACYWTGDYEAALIANDEVLRVPDLPQHVGEQALKNREWCAARLEEAGTPAELPGPSALRFASVPAEVLGDLIPDTRLAQVSLTIESDWSQFNPSIAAAPDGGFEMIVRSANYQLLDKGQYRCLSRDCVIRTTNYLARLDSGLEVATARMIAERGVHTYRSAWVRGSEDCRLFWWRDAWWVSATRRDLHADAACQMVLARLAGDGIDQLEVLDPGTGQQHEKNWMPFVRGDELYFVYACHPFTVLRWEPASSRLIEVQRIVSPQVMTRLRGGSQGVPLDDGYLFVVHEAHDDGGRRSYSHRFMLMSDELEPAALSEPFSFAHDGIEFCAGAARRGDDLVMSFGLNDHVAAIATAPLSDVLSMTEPLLADRMGRA